MRLIDSKKGITYTKVNNRIYWKEADIRVSYFNIMNILSLITSNDLITNIYNEINRK